MGPHKSFSQPQKKVTEKKKVKKKLKKRLGGGSGYYINP